MRRNYFFSRNRDALLEPCDGKLSRTVLRGESPARGLTYSTRMCCWWTREIPIRGCAALSMPARMARTASISPMRRAIRLPSILSTWRTVRLISKRRSPSRRLSLPCGNVMTNRRHVPRRWHSPTRSISFWRRYARTVPWFRPSTPSMSSSETSIRKS